MEIPLKTKRIERGYTQIEMADKLHISLRTYQRIENNKRKPSCDVVIKLQQLFNENIDKLIATI